MSILNNHFNIEEKFLGRVYEIPKKEEKKPLDLLMEQSDFIFKQITKK